MMRDQASQHRDPIGELVMTNFDSFIWSSMLAIQTYSSPISETHHYLGGSCGWISFQRYRSSKTFSSASAIRGETSANHGVSGTELRPKRKVGRDQLLRKQEVAGVCDKSVFYRKVHISPHRDLTRANPTLT